MGLQLDEFVGIVNLFVLEQVGEIFVIFVVWGVMFLKRNNLFIQFLCKNWDVLFCIQYVQCLFLYFWYWLYKWLVCGQADCGFIKCENLKVMVFFNLVVWVVFSLRCSFFYFIGKNLMGIFWLKDLVLVQQCSLWWLVSCLLMVK